MPKENGQNVPKKLNHEGLILGRDGKWRCFWVGHDPLYQKYHDEEWGIPSDDDRQIFEKICLEGFQAGLSWLTILRKREAFRQAFANFDFHDLALSDEKRLTNEAMHNDKIIRHQGKIAAVFKNARAAVNLIEQYGSFTAYLKQFSAPPQQQFKNITPLEYKTLTVSPQSVALAKDLKKWGFRFVGPTTAYAFMQAMGFVNDHISGCCCHTKTEVAQQAFAKANF